MTPPVTLRLRHLLAAMLAVSSLPACGASLRALYESDVRFEHCMALDAVSEVKPTIRRACWEEWVSFYQFGQTRDRIEYARHRRQELGTASDFDEMDDPAHKATARVAPDPTSAIAPPPLMVTSADGGAPAPAPEKDEKEVARSRCTADCAAHREACLTVCKRTASCEQACGAREKRCSARCDVKPQGSR